MSASQQPARQLSDYLVDNQPELRRLLYREMVGFARSKILQLILKIEVEIITGSVSSDHVHIYVSIPPSLSVSKFVQFVKGATSRKLQLAFQNIRKPYRGQHVGPGDTLWQRQAW